MVKGTWYKDMRRTAISLTTIAKVTGHLSFDNLIKHYDLKLELSRSNNLFGTWNTVQGPTAGGQHGHPGSGANIGKGGRACQEEAYRDEKGRKEKKLKRQKRKRMKACVKKKRMRKKESMKRKNMKSLNMERKWKSMSQH